MLWTGRAHCQRQVAFFYPWCINPHSPYHSTKFSHVIQKNSVMSSIKLVKVQKQDVSIITNVEWNDTLIATDPY